LDISVDNKQAWGINIFRNRLLNENEYELQAWKTTINDFLNPARLGENSRIEFYQSRPVFRSAIQRKITQTDSILNHHKGDRQLIQNLRDKLKSCRIESTDQLRDAETKLQQIDQVIGTMDATIYYQSAPHPAASGYPLMDVQFIGKYGWAVGAMGTILRTEDGGTTLEAYPVQSQTQICTG
jgi:hypothetical protein